MGETHRDLTPIETMDVAVCRLDGMFRDIFNTEERHDILRVAARALAGCFNDPVVTKAILWAAEAGEDKPEGK